VNNLSIGYNHYTLTNCHVRISTHAEVHAINKLPTAPRKKTPINMYVLRTDRNGFIKYSKPCNQCQQYMKKILQKRNYYLKKIYYTVDEENYEIMKL